MSVQRLDSGNVRVLHTPRVLLATQDSRFARVAGFLLARAGYDVEASRRPDEVVDEVGRLGPAVVVLEAGESLARSARMAAAVEALYPAVRVLLVTEDERAMEQSGLRVYGKWAGLERLTEEVGRAVLGLRAS